MLESAEYLPELILHAKRIFRMRATEVAATIFSCFAGLAVDRLNGAQQPRVRSAAESLGPTFVKIGQALANRPDLVGRTLADELRLLQDSMSPFDTASARAIIEVPMRASSAKRVGGTHLKSHGRPFMRFRLSSARRLLQY